MGFTSTSHQRHVGISGRCYVCVLSERDQESSSLGARSVCTRVTIKDKETNGDATCTCRYMEATICGSERLHKAVLIRLQTFVLQRTCHQAAAFLIPFSKYRPQLACIFVG